MCIATSQSCNGISGEPSSSSPPVNLRSGALRGGRKVTTEPAYALILPNLEQYPADFRHFLERDIIEISTLRRLENSLNLHHLQVIPMTDKKPQFAARPFLSQLWRRFHLVLNASNADDC
ncbi:hypothetical protein niasHT_026964 [Heterodera trifolii]|uniref:Uncharacterized protein n=1 Tax=Heterodera trifolii TaxID=157864 RepID=A0ABD2KRE6_9BILA